MLKKSEYFGKFGKMQKVVINHSTTYAGAQVRNVSIPLFIWISFLIEPSNLVII